MMTSDDDIEVPRHLRGAPAPIAEKPKTDHDRPSFAGLPDLSAGPRGPALTVRDGGPDVGGRGAGEGGLAARDQIVELADEEGGQESNLATVAVAIRKAAERAPVVGGLRVAQLLDGVRITMGNVDLLFQPPLLVRNGEEDLPVDVMEFIEALVEALGFELLLEPVPSPSAPELRIWAVQKAMMAEFMAVVDAHREGVAALE